MYYSLVIIAEDNTAESSVQTVNTVKDLFILKFSITSVLSSVLNLNRISF